MLRGGYSLLVQFGDPAQDWAESGVMTLTGRADGPAVLPPGDAATVARMLSTTIEAATADTRHPVIVDGAALLAERAAFTGRSRNGSVSVGASARLLRTRDTWAVISCARPDDLLLLGAMVEEQLTAETVWQQLASWLTSRPDHAIAERIALLGIAGGIVDERAPAHPPRTHYGQSFRTVQGALVVDFSALWAGPLCAQLLGAAGARIVKVETPQRPDGARKGNADFYRLLHGGHESVVLDPLVSSQRDALARLVASADIVIESSRPRALIGFGLDAEHFVSAGAVWVSITAGGRACERIGFGDDIAASNGLVARDSRGTPMFVGDAIADPLSGLAAAVAVLTAPADAGGLLDISMADVIGSTVRGAHSERPDVRVQLPRHRVPVGRAPKSGENTESTLLDLGIELP